MIINQRPQKAISGHIYPFHDQDFDYSFRPSRPLSPPIKIGQSEGKRDRQIVIINQTTDFKSVRKLDRTMD